MSPGRRSGPPPQGPADVDATAKQLNTASVPRPRTVADSLDDANARFRGRVVTAINAPDLVRWLLRLHNNGMSASAAYAYVEGLRRDARTTIDEAFDRVQSEQCMASWAGDA